MTDSLDTVSLFTLDITVRLTSQVEEEDRFSFTPSVLFYLLSTFNHFPDFIEGAV